MRGYIGKMRGYTGGETRSSGRARLQPCRTRGEVKAALAAAVGSDTAAELFRSLYRSSSLRTGTAVAIAVLILPALLAQSAPPRFPLTPAMVAASLGTAGLHLNASQVEMPFHLTAGTSAPGLRVQGAELFPDGRMRVRLACRIATDCIPFFATVTHSAGSNALASLSILEAAATTHNDTHQASTPGLRAGQRTTLLMQDGQMRIAIPVVSIDSGPIGSEVRLSSLDRKTAFRGTVLSPDTVEGALP